MLPKETVLIRSIFVQIDFNFIYWFPGGGALQGCAAQQGDFLHKCALQ